MPTAYKADLAQVIEEEGFAIVPSCLDEETMQRLSAHLGETSYAKRSLLALLVVRELAASVSVRTLAETVLGKACFAVKGTFFNKTRESNWKVVWHQDLTIMVRERREVPRFGPWTIKASVNHVQPPADILSRILAIRLHLDESGLDNGPLRVLPGSQKHGRFSVQKIAEWEKTSSVVCTSPRAVRTHATLIASCVVQRVRFPSRGE